MLREVRLKSPSIPKFLLYPQLRLCFQASQTRRHLGPRDSPVHRRLPPSVHCVSPTNRGVLGGSYLSLSTELSAQPIWVTQYWAWNGNRNKTSCGLSQRETMIIWQLCSSCGTHFHLQPTCHLPFWQEVYKPSLHCRMTNRMTWDIGADGR